MTYVNANEIVSQCSTARGTVNVTVRRLALDLGNSIF